MRTAPLAMRQRALQLLESVGLPDPQHIYHTYPHVDFFETGERAARPYVLGGSIYGWATEGIEAIDQVIVPVSDQDRSIEFYERSIGLRVYACATPNGYIVMPGGLTRDRSQRPKQSHRRDSSCARPRGS